MEPAKKTLIFENLLQSPLKRFSPVFPAEASSRETDCERLVGQFYKMFDARLNSPIFDSEACGNNTAGTNFTY